MREEKITVICPDVKDRGCVWVCVGSDFDGCVH